MKSAPLSELAKLIDYGVTASATDDAKGPKFLRITDIQDGVVDWASVPYCEASSSNIVRARLAVGDIVFARTGATTGKSFLIRVCPENAVFASYLIRVRAGKEIDPGYLAHFFQSPEYWRQIAIKSAGAAQPGVNATKLGELVIPLASISEQRRIAKILDHADKIGRNWAASLQYLERLRKSYLERACERGGSMTSLSSAFLDIKMGPFGSLLHKADYVSDGIPLINPMHIASGKIIPDPAYAVSVAKLNALSSYRLEENDVVIGRRGEMGRSALVSKENAGMLCGTGSMRLRVDHTVAIPEFVADFLSSPRTVRELENAASGVTMLNLSSKSFDKIFVRLPNLELQREYVVAKARIKSQISVVESGMKQTSALSTSLQHRAFRGEL